MRWIWCLFLVSPAMAQVGGVNAPPVGETRLDEPVRFGAATHDAVTVSGALGAGQAVVLTAVDGTLDLAALDGLVFEAGDGRGDATMRFTGPPDAIDAALDGLQFTPTPGFVGAARVTVSVANSPHTASWRIGVHLPLDLDAARARILAGVDTIHSGLQPGRLVTFGLEAGAVVHYPGDLSEGPVIGAARWGAGRVVAVPDHQMLNMDRYGDVSGVFYANAIAWLSAREDRGARIATFEPAIAEWLVQQGFEDTAVIGPDAPIDADVLVPPWLGPNVPEARLERIRDFVRGGGGLLICEYGVGYLWWWGMPIYDAPGNRLLREAGIGFGGGNRRDEGALPGLQAVDGRIDGWTVLDVLAAPRAVDADIRNRAAALLAHLPQAVAPDDPWYLRLDAALGDAIDAVRPTPATPVRDPWDKALLQRETDRLYALQPDEVRPHRTAEALYGAIPADAPRGERVVTVGGTSRWQSTGLYAPPGEVITVSAAAFPEGSLLRINGHTDNIQYRDTWQRPPRVHWSAPLEGETRLANPFGGAIYIDVGEQVPEPFDVTISGAVEAPLFFVGRTDDAAWRGERLKPGPQAELRGEKLAISLPSSMIRDVERIEALMAFWDQVVTAQDALGAHGHLRVTPERINIDVQISVGLLHAGYPMQGPTTHAVMLADLDLLRRAGTWGWFHELGHEAQRRPDKRWGWNNAYTFDGSVEATVNIFTSGAMQALGLTVEGGWRWTNTRADVMRRALEGIAQGPYAAQGVGTKLALFLQLKDGFGWEAMSQIFAAYVALDDLPRDEQAERDLFLRIASQVTGHDLRRFFVDTWGVGVTPATQDAVEALDLPDWLPAVGGIEGPLLMLPGETRVFDLQAAALSHDGVARVEVMPGDNFEIEAPGRVRYTAPAGGEDRIVYTVESSVGTRMESVIDIEVSTAGAMMAVWNDIPGTALAALENDPRYPDRPDSTRRVSALETAPNIGERYGARLRGFIVPPETGDYTFWVAADDEAVLRLAEDEQWGSLEDIASVPSWTQQRQWDLHPQQRSAPIRLMAGRTYAIEALMKEGGGGDHLSVAWALDDDAPALIEGDALSVTPPGLDPPLLIAPLDTCGLSVWFEATGCAGADEFSIYVDGVRRSTYVDSPRLDGYEFVESLERWADGEHTWQIVCHFGDQDLESAIGRFTIDRTGPRLTRVGIVEGVLEADAVDDGCGGAALPTATWGNGAALERLGEGRWRFEPRADAQRVEIETEDDLGNTARQAFSFQIGPCHRFQVACDLAAETCSEPADGIACAHPCDPTAQCAAGACTPQAPCDDGDPCTADMCTPDGCVATPIPGCCGGVLCAPGFACEDAACADRWCAACEGDEACGVDGRCDAERCTLACTSDEDCPADVLCVAGTCATDRCALADAGVTDGGPTVDAGLDDAGPTADGGESTGGGDGGCRHAPGEDAPIWPWLALLLFARRRR